jgi:hypothetical protein
MKSVEIRKFEFISENAEYTADFSFYQNRDEEIKILEISEIREKDKVIENPSPQMIEDLKDAAIEDEWLQQMWYDAIH